MTTSPSAPVIGMVGSGGIASVHLEAWSHLGHPVIVHSTDDPGTLAHMHGATIAPTLSALLDECDIVDVCTPSHTHHALVLAAAHAGKHVICEKPLSNDLGEAQEMIDACRQSGVQLHPGQVVRYFPEYAAARAAVHDGRIGRPAVLRLSRRGARPAAPWFADVALSGGLVVDQMIHDLDFARWVAGDVALLNARVVGHPPGPTIGLAILTHTSGALSHVNGAWGNPDEPFRTSFSIAGDAGLIRHSSAANKTLHRSISGEARPGGELLTRGAVVASPFVAELHEFARACAGGEPPRVSPDDSLAALELALAATASARSGSPISLESADS